MQKAPHEKNFRMRYFKNMFGQYPIGAVPFPD